MPAPAQLQSTWESLLAQLGVSPAAAQAAWPDLRAHYEAPDRHYHTLTHVAACLDTLATLPPLPQNQLIQLALWLHDVIYDTHAQDNETRSADYARSLLRRWALPAAAIETVAALILATDHRAAPATAAAAQIVDCDLAVLGASPAAYDDYAQAIRREYAWVPAAAYAAGRGQVLDHFLAQPHIYHTDVGRQRWEEAARANLARERAALSK